MASRNERKRKARERAAMLERAVQEAFRLEAARCKPATVTAYSTDRTRTVQVVDTCEAIPDERYKRAEPVMRFGSKLNAKGKAQFKAAVEPPSFGPLTQCPRRDKGLERGQRKRRWI